MSQLDTYPELPKNDFYYPRDFAGPIAPTQGSTQPVDMFKVQLTGGAWAAAQAANAAELAQLHGGLEQQGLFGNFDRAAAFDTSERAGALDSDANVFRFLEAVAWEFGRTKSADLNLVFEALVDRVLPVQYDDGYLSTAFGRPGQAARYSDLDHGGELAGFTALIRAGVARGRTVGRDRFVEMVVRLADHICDTFGPEGRPAGAGHDGLESALAELSRFTGNPRYILQASMFVEEYREALTGFDDFGEPVEVPADFAPSAQLLSGIVDVAVETSDDELAGAALARIRSLMDGLGTMIPASVSHRLVLAVGAAEADVVAQIGESLGSAEPGVAADGVAASGVAATDGVVTSDVVAASGGVAASAVRYADAVERELSGVVESRLCESRSGESRGEEASAKRLELLITVSQLSAFVASIGEDAVHLHTYVDSHIEAEVAGQAVILEVETGFEGAGSGVEDPGSEAESGAQAGEAVEAGESGAAEPAAADSTVARIKVVESEQANLELRVPGWATSAKLRLGSSEPLDIEPGVTRVEGVRTGDVVTLSFS